MDLITLVAVVIFGCLTLWRIHKMKNELERLRLEVEQTESAVDSAVALISGLSEQIRATAGDRDAANSLADRLDSSVNKLGAAVAANTPATVTDQVEEIEPEALEPIADEGGEQTGGEQTGGGGTGGA